MRLVILVFIVIDGTHTIGRRRGTLCALEIGTVVEYSQREEHISIFIAESIGQKCIVICSLFQFDHIIFTKVFCKYFHRFGAQYSRTSLSRTL